MFNTWQINRSADPEVKPNLSVYIIDVRGHRKCHLLVVAATVETDRQIAVSIYIDLAGQILIDPFHDRYICSYDVRAELFDLKAKR